MVKLGQASALVQPSDPPRHDPGGPAGSFAFFSPLAKVVLCIDMLLGRLELYPMLVLLMPSTWRKK